MKILHLQLQRFLREIKDKGSLMIILTKRFTLVVLSLVLFTVFLNILKFLSNYFQDHSFIPIISSIATYNYNLAKLLSEFINPAIPNEHCAKDSSTFCEEIQRVSANYYFLD